MQKRASHAPGLLFLLLILFALQTGGRESNTVFAGGNYPHLGRQVPIHIPHCNPGPETVIVSNDTQLQTNLANQAVKVICLNPGHYAGIHLDIGGTPQSLRYLIPNHSGSSIPKPWDLPTNTRVRIDYLSFESQFWIAAGLNVTSDLSHIVEFSFGANANLIDSLLIEGISERLPDGTGNRTMVRMRETSFYNAIQNSVLRNPPRVPNKDSHCLVIRDSQYNTVINNQLYDCPGDGIQLNTVNSTGWDNRGNKIYHNEIYLTGRLYASCTDPSIDANLNGPGDCACAENAIDIKRIVDAPVADAQDRTEIRGNIFYGFQETHQACGGTGDGTAAAVFIHQGSRDLKIQNNLIAYSKTGILLKDSGNGGPDYITILNNMFFNITKGRAFQFAGGINNQFSHNTIVLTLNDGNIIGRNSIAIITNATSGILSNNLVLSTNEPYSGFYNPNNSPSLIIQNNGYVGQATPLAGMPGENDMLFPQEPFTNFDEYCFAIEKLTTENHQCYPYLIPKQEAATVDTINTDSNSLPFDFFFRPRSLPYDLGATEIQWLIFQNLMPVVTLN